MNDKFGWMITNSTRNIGDDFQCIAAKQFLNDKKDLIYIDREKMHDYNGMKLKMILNGWYMHNPDSWPPSEKIIPLLTSMHISNTRQKSSQLVPSKCMLSNDGIKYLKKFSPVGCRDLFTLKELRKKGIKSYFSGCMTLTLKRESKERKEYICLVDPNEDLINFVKNKTKREIIVVYPEKDDWPLDYDERISKAHEILKIYSEAHMVITSRLHGALPPLAMEVPVLLLEGKYGDERYEGIKYFLNRTTYNDLYLNRYPIDFEQPIQNPEEYKILRRNLEIVTKAFVEDKMHEIDITRISTENVKAYNEARKRTIKFCKKYRLESVLYREIKSNIRYFIRNIENLMK